MTDFEKIVAAMPATYDPSVKYPRIVDMSELRKPPVPKVQEPTEEDKREWRRQNDRREFIMRKRLAEGRCPQCDVATVDICPECHTSLQYWD